jgi:ribosomal protein S18 acetylase RimI-like enzyme
MEPTFDVAESADVGILLEMISELAAHDGTPFFREPARGALEGLIARRELGRVWVIRAGGEAIGYVVLTLGYSLEFHGRDAFLDELYISPAHRGRGVGEKAIRFVEDACRKLGVKALHLEVERANTRAQSLYRRVGFKDHDRYLMTRMISQ